MTLLKGVSWIFNAAHIESIFSTKFDMFELGGVDIWRLQRREWWE
jgi:hypothetical protein